MQDFYNDFGFIIGFMVICLLVLMVFGERAERYLLLVTLLSMVIMRSEDIVSFMDNTFKVKEE